MNKVMNTLTRLATKTKFAIRKNSPKILLGIGYGTVTAGCIKACYDTYKKATPLIVEHKDDIQAIRDCVEDNETCPDYTEEDAKKDILEWRLRFLGKMGVIYIPSTLLIGLGYTAFAKQYTILTKRNIQLAGTCVALAEGFKGYRMRVANKYGKDAERDIYLDVHTEEIEVEETDEKGKTKTVKKKVKVANVSKDDVYTLVFSKFLPDGTINPYWRDNIDYNIDFLRSQEMYFNDLLVAKGFVVTNEIRKAIGLDENTSHGMVVGWIYDPKHPNGDNSIDFGVNWDMYLTTPNEEPVEAIILTLNADGNIYNTI